jgi:hypothetical protein
MTFGTASGFVVQVMCMLGLFGQMQCRLTE